MMPNVFTKGTSGIPLAGDPYRSQYMFPANEDWSMLCEVVSVSNGVVVGKKIWDMATGEEENFYARLEYMGQAGTPPDSAVTVGQRVVFHRVGEFNSQGKDDYEKRTENANNTSFVCFVSLLFIYVRDKGSGQGEEVAFDETGTVYVPAGSETLPMITLDPVSFFHDSTPPWDVGRIYPGQKKVSAEYSYYLVSLPGHGAEQKSFKHAAGGYNFELQVDGQGNVLDFLVSEVE